MLFEFTDLSGVQSAPLTWITVDPGNFRITAEPTEQEFYEYSGQVVQISIKASNADDGTSYSDSETFLVSFEEYVEVNTLPIRFTQEEFEVKVLTVGVAEDWVLPPIDPDSSALDHIAFEAEYEIAPFITFDEVKRTISYDGNLESELLKDKFFSLKINLIDIHGNETAYIQSVGLTIEEVEETEEIENDKVEEEEIKEEEPNEKEEEILQPTKGTPAVKKPDPVLESLDDE